MARRTADEQLLDRPIFVIGCNRTGTTLLFRNLAEHPKTWSLYEESDALHGVFHRHHPVDPARGERIAEPPAPDEAAELARAFYDLAHNKEVFGDHPVLRIIPRKALQRGMSRLYKRPPLRLVEKTPANSLRIPYLAAAFADAQFLFLVRRAADTISSLMEGWKNWSETGDGEWAYGNWHYLRPPGWQDWTGRSLAEICAFQWVEANRLAWEDLNRECADRFLLIRHEDAMADPAAVYARVLRFCDLPPSAHFDRLLGRTARRVFTHGGSAPRPEKWRDLHEAEVNSVRHMFEPLQQEFYG